ncbi:MAG: Smr/MutS family protein [Treponema sp.]|jgi:DNA-nicking Smr family endonuclease|nr:Smr/MutS family protein [Treponema sp.]
MDFGDILDAWEKQTAHTLGNRRKHPPASKPLEQKQHKNPPKPHPLTTWLRFHEVYDKDADMDETQEHPGERRRRLLHTKADAIIDLHRLTRDEAWNALECFFTHSRQQGFEKVLIVHGKGNHSGSVSVLKQVVKTFIETCPFAGESGHGSPSGGGTGVTWVLLKNKKNP